MLHDDSMLELRPARGWRVAAWTFCIFGALFGLSALAGDDVAGEVLMGLFGLVVMVGGINGAICTIRCSREGVRIRGLRARFVPAESIEAVVVRSVAGYGSARLRIDLCLRGGAKVKLTTLQRYDTPKNCLRSDSDASAIRQALGIAEAT